MKAIDITTTALYVALFTVLDYLGNQLTFLSMPNGGSVSLSVIAILVSSYHLGYKKGLLVAICCVIMMGITGTIYTVSVTSYVLEYLVAFGVYGLASIFKNYKYFYSGVLIVGVIRLLCHLAAGVIFWETTLWGSLLYNGPYMAATTLLSLILVPIICKYIKPLQKKY